MHEKATECTTVVTEASLDIGRSRGWRIAVSVESIRPEVGGVLDGAGGAEAPEADLAVGVAPQ